MTRQFDYVPWWSSMWIAGESHPNRFDTCKLCGELHPSVLNVLEEHSNSHLKTQQPVTPVAWEYTSSISSGSYSPPFDEKVITRHQSDTRGKRDIRALVYAQEVKS
jgi:hypothetical protein